MRRRNFVTTLLAGAAALPLVGKAVAKSDETEPKKLAPKTIDRDCTCLLQHRESYSGNRAIDARIISDTCRAHGPRERA